MTGKLPHIFVTMGDIHGVGPEVTLKALQKVLPERRAIFTLVGVKRVYDHYRELLGIRLPQAADEEAGPEALRFMDQENLDVGPFRPGTVSRKVGHASVAFIHAALQRIQHIRKGALVTAPIAKEAIWRAGFLFPGQTELLADYFGIKNFAMMLVSGPFRVAFVTTHLPLKDVPAAVTQEQVVRKVLTVRDDLRRRFRVKRPKFALAALNPHGGERGMLGREEMEVLMPAVQELQERRVAIEGPFPADTLFTPERIRRHDVFVALYHDQGMIPIKMHAFGKAVNYTAGLPVVRTSPDHGTAFDIAGKGVADESSMVEAIHLAIELVH